MEYIRDRALASYDFSEIVPDTDGQWLNQSNTDFASLMPLADRETKRAKAADEERAVFGLYSVGISTNRDEWVYDFNENGLSDKVLFFCRTYRNELQRFELEKPDADSTTGWVDPSIKWTTELEQHLVRGDSLTFSERHLISGLYRPYISKHCYYAPIITHRRYQMPQIFPHGHESENKVICFPGNAASNGFRVLATDRVFSHDLLKTTQCLPLYRYTPEGQRVSNITNWAIRRINDHYRALWRDDYPRIAGDHGITAEDIFAYTYAVLHDPEYREKYAVDLLREFPRLPLYRDFDNWKRMGQDLLDLHINFESAGPYPLERVEKSNPPGKTALRADKERGVIVLDEKTTLTGVPESAWGYRLGSRSALEWVLDQYKERAPRDPTIRERFNTYSFADHKERVIDLLQRVCTVSVETEMIIQQINLLVDTHTK